MDLTLTEAWGLWWSGQQLTEHTLYGAPVLWLGRAGKLLAFLAGTTIVLDVIGSERIVEWGKKARRSGFLVIFVFALFPVLALVITETIRPGEWLLENFPPWVLGLTMAVLLPLVWWSLSRLPLVSMKLVVGFGRILESRRFERWIRTVAVPLFFVGFGLDYLAS